MIEEKARQELHKDAARSFKPMLEVESLKTAAVWPLTTHLADLQIKEHDELISDVLLWTPTHGNSSVGRQTKSYIYQYSLNTGCRLEDLPRAMADRGGWQERVEEICAVSTP